MLVIASVPSAHPYVTALLPLLGTAGAQGAEIVRLPDPTPVSAPEDPAVWWPPRILEPDWVREHRDEIDVVHLHFGFESRTPEQLSAWVAELAHLDIPLVLTVHDLANPHLSDQAPHQAALAVLVPAAKTVITLTEQAGALVRARWGVEAQVVPHPLMAGPTEIMRSDELRSARRGGPARIGMPLGALRAGTDPTPWAGALVTAADACGAIVDATVQRSAARADERRAGLTRRLETALRPPHRLRHIERLPQEDLVAWLSGLDVLVLPYRHGTHSGWLELAWDLGTSVVAPAVGCFAGQHDDRAFFAEFAADGTGVEAALRSVLDARRTELVPWGDGRQRADRRRAELADVRGRHRDLYRGSVAGIRPAGLR